MYAPDQNVTRLPIRDDTARGFPGVSGVTVRLMGDGELSRLEVPMDPDRRLLATELAGGFRGSDALRRCLAASRASTPGGGDQKDRRPGFLPGALSC
jgi:hypothetical protein